MRAVTVALALVLVPLAGCVGGLQDTVPSADDATTADGPALGPASGLPTFRNGTTLAEPPEWAVGEWWTVAYDNLLAGGSGETTRVVAGAGNGTYLVGMAADKFADEIMLLHFPGMGRIDRTDLSFDAHDRRIQLLDFPLEQGRTWTTQWYGGTEMTAEVTEVDGDEATVLLTGDGPPSIELIYDASLGAIAEFRAAGYLHYEVVDHGFGYPAPVDVPYKHDLVFCHGRVLVQAIEPCSLSTEPNPKGPSDTITLDIGYDRVSFGLLMADVAPQPDVGQGVYAVEATAPDGTSWQATKLPSDGGIKLVAHGHDDPSGDWEATYVTGGPGYSLLEGVAYEVLSAQTLTGNATG